MNALRKYLDEERGRGSELARELDVTPGAIWQWANSKVPAERIFKISQITNIPVELLRPDMIPNSNEAA